MAKKKDLIAEARFNLLRTQPFLASLIVSGKCVITSDIPTAATDGRNFLFNEKFMASLKDRSEREAVFAHEVMHCALQHVLRSKKLNLTDAYRANVAADIIVNELVREMGLSLPESAITKPEWASLSLKEIYDLLENSEEGQKMMSSLANGTGEDGDSIPSAGGQCLQGDIELSDSEVEELEKTWDNAVNSALAQSRLAGKNPGKLLQKIFDDLQAPKVNWKAVLRRYLSSQPITYAGYDRRFLHTGTFVDGLGGESLDVKIFVDTSGSCFSAIKEMMPEVVGIVESYPWVKGSLYYFDTLAYGPHNVQEWEKAKPEGSGGTLWDPIQKVLDNSSESLISPQNSVVIIITDGYFWEMPESSSHPTIWAVTPGGAEDSQFPFGEVVRIADSE